MAIKKQEFLYEVLLRFNADGLQGAHQQNLTRYVDNGQVVSEIPGEAVPLAPDAIAGLMDAQVPILTAQIAELKAEVQRLREAALVSQVAANGG